MRLIDCFIGLMAYTADAMRAPRELTFEQFQKDVERLIEESEKLRYKEGFTEEEYNEARFAVFAWVDEVVLCSQWAERDQWKKQELQLIHFNTSNAGEEFFDRLDMLAPDADHAPLLEVYCTCLVLGFRGKYFSIRDTFELEDVVKAALSKLRRGAEEDFSSKDTRFFPKGYLKPPERARKRFQLGASWLAIGLMLIASVVVLLFFMGANNSLNDLQSFGSLTVLLR